MIKADEGSARKTAQRGKGRPTPKRRQAQARKARPLVGPQTKEARQAFRAEEAARRERVRAGMAAGDERYLPERDKGVQRRFIRDWVDARFSIGEILLPALFVVVIWSFLPISQAVYGSVAMFAIMILVVIDTIFMNIFLQRRLRLKFGKDNIQKGFRWYAFSRATQMRIMRIPKPQVKHGHWPK